MTSRGTRRRVLLLTTSYPSRPDDPSGHFVETHAEDLAGAGAGVHVLAPCDRSPRRVGNGSIQVRPLAGRDLFGWPGATERLRERPGRIVSALPFVASVTAALREVGPVDRYVAHWLTPSAAMLALAGAPGIEAWAHGADVRLLRSAPSFLRERIVRRLLEGGTSFVFVSEPLRRSLLEALPPSLARRVDGASRVEPPPIRVPPKEDLADPRRPGELASGYVVWVGRHVPSKRAAAAAAAAAAAGLPLVMIGDGTMVPPPCALALGRLPRRETLRWIAHASALVSTSRQEGAPTVVREARALGVPVVAEPSGDLEAWAARDEGIRIAHDTDDISAILGRVTLNG